MSNNFISVYQAMVAAGVLKKVGSTFDTSFGTDLSFSADKLTVTVAVNNDGNDHLARSLAVLTPGYRYYIEATINSWYDSVGNANFDTKTYTPAIGFIPENSTVSNDPESIYYWGYGWLTVNNSAVTQAVAKANWGTNVGIMLDLVAGTVEFYVDGVKQGDTYTGVHLKNYRLFVSSESAKKASVTVNFGDSAFSYPKT